MVGEGGGIVRSIYKEQFLTSIRVHEHCCKGTEKQVENKATVERQDVEERTRELTSYGWVA